ncbi:SubName: Full=Uncharacterized protein {ECO:0000313/EMBL:CCA68599.1} [Serendipita indica DSM 11827]|uniref:DUF3752 domain-containing protein n=1 Tax=Serendipita indica (strain DSM 11827) TaxID=1109443 RepID=G4TB99_SERID|nr:SubName: Full=Uncharacterized protein {ECO:0000313/EMBL:CCA68599.1} [Serendipita indica DSM 11827]CCA68599.1 hypothetical protein PIIN_02464 [Serendipita indica DSM 11827]
MIGPALPPHLRRNSDDAEKGDNQTNTHADSDDDGAYGPALPPSLARQRQIEPVKEQKSTVNPDSDDDSDIVGPQLPSASGSKEDPDEGVREFLAREQRRKALAEEEKKPKQPKREEWMLAPPTSSEALQSLDPTKIKNRQFSRATGREEVSKDTSLWTETPSERQARLAEELSGKRKRATAKVQEEDGEGAYKRRKMQDDLRREIDDHNRMARPASLLEMHQETLAKQPSSTKDEAIWDRDRDMGSAGRLLDQSSRNKMIKDAKGLSDRFGSGKRGAYD